MNFDFSDDQRRLQDAAGRALTARSTSKEVRRVLEGEAAYSAGTWRALAELGALGIAIPEQWGGSGLGYLELCLVAEEAGRNLAAVPLLSSVYLAAEVLLRAPRDQQRARLLPKIASGDAVITAMIDPRGHRVPKDSPLRFEGGLLNGTANAVPDGAVADAAVILVGDVLLLADLEASGVTRKVQALVDPTRPLAQLRFDSVPAEVLCSSGGAAIARRVLDGAAVLLAFEQLGGADKALETARLYALERRAFGRVIAGFQAVRHKLADMYVCNELARGHAYYGAWALASAAPELPKAAAAARVAATTAYNFVAEEGMHLHGGIGATWEMDCHLHLRRSRWLGQIIGSEHFWRGRLTDALIEEAI